MRKKRDKIETIKTIETVETIETIKAKEAKEAKEAKIKRKMDFVAAKSVLRQLFGYVKREDNDRAKYRRYSKALLRLKRKILIFDVSHSSEKSYPCRVAFANKRPRVGGRFVADPVTKPKLKKYARRGRPRKLATSERPPLENRHSTQVLPRKNNHHENEF